MTKALIYQALIIFIIFLFAVSALGYLLFPSKMLSVVGIASNPHMDFLVRTLSAALIALIPGAWSVRKRGEVSLFPNMVLGLAIYMFLSSAVDLHAFVNRLVNSNSVPSIVMRVVIGAAILWLRPQK